MDVDHNSAVAQFSCEF